MDIRKSFYSGLETILSSFTKVSDLCWKFEKDNSTTRTIIFNGQQIPKIHKEFLELFVEVVGEGELIDDKREFCQIRFTTKCNSEILQEFEECIYFDDINRVVTVLNGL